MAGASSALREQPFDRALAARRKSSSLRPLPSSGASRHLALPPGPAKLAGRPVVRETIARNIPASPPLESAGLAVPALARTPTAAVRIGTPTLVGCTQSHTHTP